MSPTDFILATAMLGLAAVAGHAQGTTPQWAKPGDTVKVWAEVPRIRGSQAVVRRIGSDTIHFTVRSSLPRTWLETPIAQGQIKRVAVRDSAVRSPGRTALGAVAGAVVVGAATGAMTWFFYSAVCPTRSNDCDDSDPPDNRRLFTTYAAQGGAVTGAVIGGIIGGRPVLGWRRVFP